jgi:ATP-dependent DNA helicase RecQ
LNYYVDDILDDEIQDELHEYFIDSDSNEIENAIKEFDDIDEMDIRLFRIKFISELAN